MSGPEINLGLLIGMLLLGALPVAVGTLCGSRSNRPAQAVSIAAITTILLFWLQMAIIASLFDVTEHWEDAPPRPLATLIWIAAITPFTALPAALVAAFLATLLSRLRHA
jgi:uncharacterized membrane protein YkvI